MIKFFLLMLSVFTLITSTGENEVVEVKKSEKEEPVPDSETTEIPFKILNYNVRTEIPLMTPRPKCMGAENSGCNSRF